MHGFPDNVHDPARRREVRRQTVVEVRNEDQTFHGEPSVSLPSSELPKMDCRISNWRASVSEYASHFCNRSAGCLPIQGPLGVKTGTARTEHIRPDVPQEMG